MSGRPRAQTTPVANQRGERSDSIAGRMQQRQHWADGRQAARGRADLTREGNEAKRRREGERGEGRSLARKQRSALRLPVSPVVQRDRTACRICALCSDLCASSGRGIARGTAKGQPENDTAQRAAFSFLFLSYLSASAALSLSLSLPLSLSFSRSPAALTQLSDTLGSIASPAAPFLSSSLSLSLPRRPPSRAFLSTLPRFAALHPHWRTRIH